MFYSFEQQGINVQRQYIPKGTLLLLYKGIESKYCACGNPMGMQYPRDRPIVLLTIPLRQGQRQLWQYAESRYHAVQNYGFLFHCSESWVSKFIIAILPGTCY